MAGYSSSKICKKRAAAGCTYLMRYFKGLCMSLNRGERKQGVLRGRARITPKIKDTAIYLTSDQIHDNAILSNPSQVQNVMICVYDLDSADIGDNGKEEGVPFSLAPSERSYIFRLQGLFPYTFYHPIQKY